MGQDISKVFTFGPAQVLVNSVDVGHTDDAGFKVVFKNNWVKAMAGKYGKTPVGVWSNGQTAQVEFNLIQTIFGDLTNVLPLATKVTNASNNSKLTFGQFAGVKLTAVALQLLPFIAGNTPLFNMLSSTAVPVGDFDLLYTGDKYQIWHCVFDLLINEAGGTNGNFLLQFGDNTIIANPTTPTVSSVVPADNATAVATSTPVTWTLSASLDGNTVNSKTVHLLQVGTLANLENVTDVAGSIVLTNNGASTTIVFTPTVALTAGKTYIAILEDGTRGGIKDQTGNALVFFESDFST